MFEFFRKNTRYLAAPLFLLIIVAFVMVGVDSYKGFVTKGKSVATVDGHSITEEELAARHRMQIERLRATQPGIDTAGYESDAFKLLTLEGMVREQAINAYIQKLHLTTSDARLAKELQQLPVFEALKKPDGSFDQEKYRQMLATQGMSPAQFEAQVRSELTYRQVMGALAVSSFETKQQVERFSAIFQQQRDIALQFFVPKGYESKVQLADADVESYFQEHKSDFRTEDNVDVEYILFTSDDAKKQVKVSDADVAGFYEKNKQQFAEKEQRRASHILITAGKDMPAAEREKARATAQKLLEQVRANPKQFAAIAKQNSQDPGSAKAGGDLGFFGRGAMVKPFEEAVFAMQKGAISEVVESDFGFHIIMLTDIKPETVPALDVVKEKIRKDLEKQQADSKFNELADVFSNGVFEQANSYADVAKKLGISPVSVDKLSKTNAATLSPVLASPKVLEQVFATGAALDRNSESVEFEKGKLLSFRIKAQRPAADMDFAAAKDKVKSALLTQKSLALAETDAKAKLNEVSKQGAAQPTLPVSATVSRAKLGNFAPALNEAIFRTAVDKLPAPFMVNLGNDGYAVGVIKAVHDSAGAGEGSERYAAFLKQARSNGETVALDEALKAMFKAKISFKPVSE